jgi:hypothetical protein
MHRPPLPFPAAVWFALAVIAAAAAGPAAAQAWNAPAALDLADRAIARRGRVAVDTALRDYRAHAHGFVFFLGQFGDGLSGPPRLIKADQLELEVYWKAPRYSKQRIVGWRDRAELPTDISYHIDHLGIVQNNFGALIRLGDGDEVRDVPHPLSPIGPARYEFALGDTTTIRLPQRDVRVATLLVRPRPPATSPAVAGTLFLDVETADLVRMAISFTPASYVDGQLEDVSIVLENALWEGRFWLPYRQEIEIRRRATWLDIAARGIIRGRWDVDGYEFNLGLAERWFHGPEITAVPRAEREQFPWERSLAEAIQDVAEPVRRNDLEQVRAEVARVAGGRALSGLRPRRLGARRVSDLVHANRVEGVALGAGLVWRVRPAVETRALASYGTADGRPKGLLTVTATSGRLTLEGAAFHVVRDVADDPVAAPLVNSFAAQEFGDDYGDYYRLEGGRLQLRGGVGARGEWSMSAARAAVRSLRVHGAPASGRYRPNPALGSGATWNTAVVALRRRSGGVALRRDLLGEVTVEAGARDDGAGYARVSVGGQALLPAGATRLLLRAAGGAASADLPLHRSFVLGGRGTLPGDGFRSWGGRRAALLHVEWRLPVPGPAVGVGTYARIPTTLTVAPFAAAGWADGAMTGAPWRPAPDARLTVGLGLEWLGVVRIEVGVGLQSRRAQLAVDLARDFWPIL